MPKSPHPVVIEELARLNRHEKLRIDWLGDVFPQGPGDLQNTIEVFLSPLKPDVTGVLVSPDAADISRQMRIRLGVGYLPILYNGAIFQAGRPVRLRPERSVRQRLVITPSRSRFVNVHQKVPRFNGEQRQLEAVQRSEYALGRAWAQGGSSHLLAIPDTKNVDPYYVLIPCIEVVRFFFCMSSVFARSLFAHGWDDLIWLDKCDKSKLPQEITIGLQTVHGLTYADSKYLAYKFLGGKTQDLIDTIRRSIQSPGPNLRSRSPLKCDFPFDDDTEIEAEVVKIQTGTSLKARYFVTRLLKCKRHVPFSICYA